ncbi:MAG: phage head closure protein [Ruminococcus flavefaciens]|nr:phage head closure protein [Ruminococcus flavefaciens]MCM1061476.1 phage head closure protein [Eubacterium sp.]
MAYNKKIEVQLLHETKDEIGQIIAGWETVFRPWAEISCTSGREYYAAAQTNSENDMMFKIRWSKKIAGKLTSELRIIYNRIVYNIVHIEDTNEQHRELIIRARQLNGEART